MIRKILLMVLILAIGTSIFSGCIDSINNTKIDNRTDIKSSDLKISEFESTQGLKKFSSIQEIREFLKDNAQSTMNYGVFGGAMDAVMIKSSREGAGIQAPQIAIPSATSAAISEIAGSDTSGTSDYSKTNIQVEGVDEADFVKNDGNYIYVLSEEKLVIADAYPAEKARILSEITIPGRPKNLFVNNNKIVVFTENYHQVMLYPEYEYRPVQRYTQNTSAIVYDISDRREPEKIANFDITGNYFQARMIGDFVYFIVKDSVYYYANTVDVPAIKQMSGKVIMPDIYYFDNPEQNYVFHTIASIDLGSNTINAKSFMMGYSDNLYVSGNNIYITYKKNLPIIYYQKEQEERFYNIVVPQLPADARDRINEIRDSKLDPGIKWDKISSILEETYNRMTEKEKQNYQTGIDKAVEEYEIRLAKEREKTVIQKIRINRGNIEYQTKGEVPGSLLNQFSMDENMDYLRVATTTQFWSRTGSIQYNNVYILDEDLGIIGKLEEIAPDERIYSTRFIGNRLYMVTFKRIDPLFVIDLTDPRKPEILGKLKIPGFSDYLHPYDENHIIGVGKETADNGWGGVSIKGVKLSLFDVSDVNSPRQVDVYEIGAAGTDSEALRDHKAFLFDRKKSLLVIPIREISESGKYDSRYGYYRQKIWQGAYVFGINIEGFTLKGKISHLDDYEEQDFYWNSPSAVRRSLYMEDVLYTISAKKILMNSLFDLSEINRIELPFEINKYNEYGWN